MAIHLINQDDGEVWTVDTLKSMIRKEKEIRDKALNGLKFEIKLQGVPIELLDKEDLITIIRVMQGKK